MCYYKVDLEREIEWWFSNKTWRLRAVDSIHPVKCADTITTNFIWLKLEWKLKNDYSIFCFRSTCEFFFYWDFCIGLKNMIMLTLLMVNLNVVCSLALQRVEVVTADRIQWTGWRNTGIDIKKVIRKERNTNLALHHHQDAQLWAAGLGEKTTEAQLLHPNQNREAPLW